MRSTDDTMPVILWPAASDLRPFIEQLAPFYRVASKSGSAQFTSARWMIGEALTSPCSMPTTR
ncbi:hypothetical protein [Streptomyces neyagawaensis]|uniref:hypothetical protein n=1 Tax=Streptomyces neyagawaensis TaxID=42238 RepID=UPI0012FEBDA4|nr:hypothetical protein [Streptomyces neyagawaensis]MCL6735078.1 hypothetical protein [Streptomyces neyagawaensis]MDE1687473.1 hypothetical protein [Streptomyces neyagawaensis]